MLIAFTSMAADPYIRAVIFTAGRSVFLFGFDIPEFLSYSRESFSRYLKRFTSLYRYLFTYPKPLVAALNGHAIAGGCMIALACDYRIMVSGKARTFLKRNWPLVHRYWLAAWQMLEKFVAGGKNGQSSSCPRLIGMMYSAEEAARLGMIDLVSTDERLGADAQGVARRLAAKDGAAFSSMKGLKPASVADEMATKEEQSCRGVS